MTQQSLAEKVYVTRQTVSRWEGGERYPDLVTVKKLAQVLGVDAGFLLSDDETHHIVERNPVVEKTAVNNVTLVLFAGIVISYIISVVGVLIRIPSFPSVTASDVWVLGGNAIGTVAGFIWIGIAGGTLLLLKQFEIIGKSEVPLLWLWIITTILFTVMHGGANEAGILPVVNVVTMCLFTTALYEAEGTLLAPIMAHAVWNIVGSLYLGGVSLADDYPHLLTLSASANTLLSGGNYKIEASIVTTALNIVLMTFFWVRYRKKKAVE